MFILNILCDSIVLIYFSLYNACLQLPLAHAPQATKGKLIQVNLSNETMRTIDIAH